MLLEGRVALTTVLISGRAVMNGEAHLKDLRAEHFKTIDRTLGSSGRQ